MPDKIGINMREKSPNARHAVTNRRIGTMLRKMVSYFTLPLLLLLSNSPENSATSAAKSSQDQNGTLERMIVANGIVTMDLDLKRLRGIGSGTQESWQGL